MAAGGDGPDAGGRRDRRVEGIDRLDEVVGHAHRAFRSRLCWKTRITGRYRRGNQGGENDAFLKHRVEQGVLGRRRGGVYAYRGPVSRTRHR
jgi:hypothetical protein